MQGQDQGEDGPEDTTVKAARSGFRVSTRLDFAAVIFRMDKLLAGREGPVIGITSCHDLHQKLRIEGERLEGKWHAYDAFNFVLTAWHLYQDWLPGDKLGRPVYAPQKGDKHRLPQQMKLVLDVLRDLCAGSENFQVNLDAAQKRGIEETHSGAIGDWYAYFTHERIPGVTAEGDYYFSVRKLRNITHSYFDWVFDDEKPAQKFPGELLWVIWRCSPKNRDAAAVPPLGAIPGDAGDSDFVAWLDSMHAVRASQKNLPTLNSVRTPRMAKITAAIPCTSGIETFFAILSPRNTAGTFASIIPNVVPSTTCTMSV